MILSRYLGYNLCHLTPVTRNISGLGYGDKDTIFALSTPPGKSAISIIRITGDHALPTLHALIQSTNKITPRKAVLRRVYSPITIEPIDRAVVLWFPEGGSFTGEDTVELHLHGSPAVIRATLRCLRGVKWLRPAQPGEFTQRALANGRMSLLEVEALSELVNSETEMQRKVALSHMEGQLTRVYEKWTEQLIGAVANMEAHIDFSESESLGSSLAAESMITADEVLQSVTQFLKDSQIRDRIKNGFTVVIIGPPNVGKSSLMNLLSQREVAITSPTPGTTRDIVECRLEIGGMMVSVCDTAGLRATSDQIECEGIGRAIIRAKEADIIVAVLDVSEVSDFPDVTQSLRLIGRSINCDILKIMTSCDASYILVNKSDLLDNRPEIKNAQYISCKDNQGVSEFLESLSVRIGTLIECGLNDDVIIVGERHQYHLTEVASSLSEAIESTDTGISAEYLRHSLYHLGHITGKIGVENILSRIFSKFCIGK
ncbi:tRNA modification GTPase GTPBP3, mitochondrial [Oopsacas minuta]|uniref:tRNA modification GTPase GTPBP3, mitochondrial n=1 Tax=Oopsacas minuta TaxID=111878 RepID=A0AAV7K712_9METZ|nr:tRNA modification GTPase GTPBP3, mitochondrial [Oopsacas minuta]